MISLSRQLVPALFGALLTGHATSPIAFAAPKTAPKPAKKPIAAPVLRGVIIKAEGGCLFQATFSKGDSNVLGRPYKSLELNKFGDYASKSTAAVNNNINVIVNFVQETPEESETLATARAFTITLASKGGFRAGQIIPIVVPRFGAVRASQSFMDFTQNAREKRRETNPGGRTRTRDYYESATWIATSGSVRIASVSLTRVTFSIKNARFAASQGGIEQNKARGSFVMNGIGQLTYKIPRGIF